MEPKRMPLTRASEFLPALEALPVLRVLVADADAKALDTIARMAQRLGFVTITATTPTAAFLAVCARPDVVLLDLQFPSDHGWSIADDIRNDREHDNTAIIAMTSSFDLELREKAARWSNGFLLKPFTLRQLSTEVLVAMAVRRRVLRDSISPPRSRRPGFLPPP